MKKGIRRLIEMVKFQREIVRVLREWNAGLVDGEAAMTEIANCEAWRTFKLQASDDYTPLPDLDPTAELIFNE